MQDTHGRRPYIPNSKARLMTVMGGARLMTVMGGAHMSQTSENVCHCYVKI